MVEFIKCRFCREIELAANRQGQHFAETDALIALPTLGCFVVGYSLIVPKEHLTSFAAQSPEQLRATEAFLESIRAKSEELFGPTIVAEHGTGAPEEPTAACCDHAHLHIVPTRQFDQVLDYYQRTGGPGVAIDDLTALSAYEGNSYLTLSRSAGDWRVWPGASRFPRQCIRRAIANAEGNGELFDWRGYPHHDNMAITATMYRYAFKPENTGNDPQSA